MGINQKITVCHVLSGDLWAGAEVQVYSLLMSLQSEQCFEISVIVLNEGKLSDLLSNAGFRVAVIDEDKNRFWTIVKKASAELAGRRIDIFHSHRYKENVLGLLLKRRCQIEHLVQTVHGIQERLSGFKSLKAQLYRYFNGIASNGFDRFITVSDDIRRRRSNHFDLGKMVTIHNAVDISRVVLTRQAGVVRKELGIGDSQPLIGAVGRMVPVKGFDRFLAAAKVIAERRPDAKFVLVGDGPQRVELENLARSQGLNNQVRFLGFRDDILDIVNCFDLFVMTSHHEGIPIVLLEGMVLKRPVVAMSVGGIPEVIEDNISGLLVKSGDVEHVAEACLELLDHPDRARMLGEAARRRVETEFSMDVHRDRVVALYKDVVGRK